MWLMEFSRILKKGGIAYITIHSEKTFMEMEKTWPLYKGIGKHPEYNENREKNNWKDGRLIFRWLHDKSYSSNVFYEFEYYI